MAKNYYDITLALSGLCQSVRLVQQLAYEGLCDKDALHTSLNSLLQIDPPSTLAVYGDNDVALKIGLETLQCILNVNRQPLSAELTRYALGIMVLERKLSANKSALNTLGGRISQLDRQLVHFDLGSDTMFSSLASIYTDVISPLSARIHVLGNPDKLKNQSVQDKIRATLLAGIRSAVLWQQRGGGRWQLMFSRHRLLKQAQSILARC
ncbi:high frequency lysogenization protein HflD [Candidatus Fukatsuia symbiotica]|uniref:high frequency lysogenization protein HflD n=1 Tax=Candidatus Fukatsuia symbiotica TaxID=1878942 RepID=UPI002B247E1F|nr:high frequency lysogenization protein HflD [Candidatus Fukatsuia symbiotica]MEA9444675.1 high frequency lysogenization protein HflD [Candidatus Fukatsuia symbiotica]